MLARIVVLESWGFSGRLNTLMPTLNQRKCLDMLVQPMRIAQALQVLKPANMVHTHGAPVSNYVFSVEGAQGRQWLESLPRQDMLERRSASTDHPLMPCALLRAFRLAARVNDAWTRLLPAGKLDAAGRTLPEPYAAALSKPLSADAVDAVDAATGELLAAVMVAEIFRANELSDQLLERATQAECLDELFRPGGLRRKLLSSGVSVPLR